MAPFSFLQALVVDLKLTTTHTPLACGISLADAFGASQSGWPIVPGPQSSSDKRQKGSGDKQLGGGEGACTDLRRASPRRAGPEGVQDGPLLHSILRRRTFAGTPWPDGQGGPEGAPKDAG